MRFTLALSMPRRFAPLPLKRRLRAFPPKPYIPKPQPPKELPRRPKLFEGPYREGPSHLEKLYERSQKHIENDEPHFQIGKKKVYFPFATVVLLRPNPKHTPYQAKFLVPTSFNKLDLRDYLWNVYGLRALNITTQLLWRKWAKAGPRAPRYRVPQVKKMTIDMEDPFVWPKPLTKEEIDEEFHGEFTRELRKYGVDAMRIGSDRLRPPTSFDGILGPYVEPASPFIPKRMGKIMMRKKEKAEKNEIRAAEENIIKRHLGFS